MVLFYQLFLLTKILTKGVQIILTPHVLRITVEDNFINDYKEEKCVYQDELKGQLDKFWETESVGLNNYTENDKLTERFNDELKFNKTRYCVKLLFREHHDFLSDNF